MVDQTKAFWWERYYVKFAEPFWDFPYVAALVLAEFVLGSWIILKIPYTEIDWIAYMEEVDFWINGEYDYRKIRGNTGPLVYPAGFLYLFGFLQWLTGREIRTAQVFFLGFYLATQAVVMILYTLVSRELRGRSTVNNVLSNHQVWSLRVAMGFLCLSKRYHSIFLLRLFNDGPTMLVAYISFWCFMKGKWDIGCFLYSVAVSLKMNVLLFAPGLLYLLIQASPSRTIPRLAICALTQLVIGAPFLWRYPVSYLRKAFELDRKFFFEWTVNFKFLSEETFLSKEWAIFLLLLHLSLLGIYMFRLYKARRSLSSEHVLSVLLVCNFIGICCSRTLHYQFLSWYVSALPFLLWRGTNYPIMLRMILLGAVEYAFLTFPATATSSLVLQGAHWAILLPCIFGDLQSKAPLSLKKEQ